MSKKRYMELLLEQIRNKRAKELVAHEITSHIEDQEEAYRAQGLTAYDAERRAVLDMGDPVETGVSLDACSQTESPGVCHSDSPLSPCLECLRLE